MIACEAFKAAHLLEIEADASQALEHEDAPDVGRAFERAGNAYTIRHNGRIVVCGGFAASDLGDAHLWGVVARRAPMVVLHRAVRRLLEVYRGLGRVVATSDATFAAGCRWLELLGFNREGVLPQYGFGVDHVLYAREL